MNPRSTDCEADALTTTPSRRLDVKVIPWELQHRMVVVDLDKKILKKVVIKERIIRRKIWKLNENQTRVRFEKKSKRTCEHRCA